MDVGQRKALGYMHPGRADVIGAGAVILSQVLRRTPVSSVLVSEQDILDGIAWSALDRPAPDDSMADPTDHPGPATGPTAEQPPPDQGS
jgi:exopolyphosphatase/guanosine-5'-triphosphate,3'-diphosphate pyrophosphatase